MSVLDFDATALHVTGKNYRSVHKSGPEVTEEYSFRVTLSFRTHNFSLAASSNVLIDFRYNLYHCAGPVS